MAEEASGMMFWIASGCTLVGFLAGGITSWILVSRMAFKDILKMMDNHNKQVWAFINHYDITYRNHDKEVENECSNSASGVS